MRAGAGLELELELELGRTAVEAVGRAVDEAVARAVAVADGAEVVSTALGVEAVSLAVADGAALAGPGPAVGAFDVEQADAVKATATRVHVVAIRTGTPDREDRKVTVTAPMTRVRDFVVVSPIPRKHLKEPP